MQSVISWATTPEFSLLGFSLGLFGLLTGFVFYFKSKKERRPTYLVRTTTLVEGNPNYPEGLAFTYRGVVQPRIAVSKLLFWNGGRETIRRADLIDSDPLRVKVSNATILDVQAIKIASENCSFRLSHSTPEDFSFGFDYLEQQEYILIQIVHTGKDDADIQMFGKVLGAARIEQRTPRNEAIRDRVTRIVLSEPYYRVVEFSAYTLPAVFGVYLFARQDYSWYSWILLLWPALAYWAIGHRGAPIAIK